MIIKRLTPSSKIRIQLNVRDIRLVLINLKLRREELVRLCAKLKSKSIKRVRVIQMRMKKTIMARMKTHQMKKYLKLQSLMHSSDNQHNQ